MNTFFTINLETELGAYNQSWVIIMVFILASNSSASDDPCGDRGELGKFTTVRELLYTSIKEFGQEVTLLFKPHRSPF